MKLRTFAATATAALIGASALMIPVANAVTVTVNGNLCTITYTAQDINDLRHSIANSDTETIERLKAEFPSLGDGLNLLIDELQTQMINTGGINQYALSEQAQDVYFSYILLGIDEGFTVEDLAAMLVAPVMPALMSITAAEMASEYIGTNTITKSGAQEVVERTERIKFSAAIDFTNGMHQGKKLSAKALQIITPSEAVTNVTADSLAQPFQECVDGEGEPVVEDTPPVVDEDNTDSTQTPKPGGNKNNGGGGSSFGSS